MKTHLLKKRKNISYAILIAILKRVLAVGISLLILTGILFLSAGWLGWPMGWVFIGLYSASIALNAVVLIYKDPELVAERTQVKAGVKQWDKMLSRIVGIYGLAVTLAVAGLDERFEWSPRPVPIIQFTAIIVSIFGYLLTLWAKTSNRYYSTVVRLQEERGHTTVSNGPYRYIRHPGYLGMIASQISIPFILGTLWALFPASLMAGFVFIRTGLEDRTLRDELKGYKDYTERVQYRLLPYLW